MGQTIEVRGGIDFENGGLLGVKSHVASSFGLKCFLVQEAFLHASGGEFNEYQADGAENPVGKQACFVSCS